MRETFLGADRGDDFALGIKVNVIALLVPARHRTTQARNALRYRIAMRMHAFFVVQLRLDVVGVGATHRSLDQLVEDRSEEHTSELQSLMRISYAVFCLKQKNKQIKNNTHN